MVLWKEEKIQSILIFTGVIPVKSVKQVKTNDSAHYYVQKSVIY